MSHWGASQNYALGSWGEKSENTYSSKTLVFAAFLCVPEEVCNTQHLFLCYKNTLLVKHSSCILFSVVVHTLLTKAALVWVGKKELREQQCCLYTGPCVSLLRYSYDGEGGPWFFSATALDMENKNQFRGRPMSSQDTSWRSVICLGR